jgi:hypothetical protein
VLQSAIKRHAKFLQQVRLPYFNVPISVLVQTRKTITVYGFTTCHYMPVIELPEMFLVIRVTLPHVLCTINMYGTVWAATHRPANQPFCRSWWNLLFLRKHSIAQGHTLCSIPCKLLTWRVKLPLCTPWRYKGVEAQLYSFLTSALDRSEWSALDPVRFIPGEECRYPLNKRLFGPQSRCRWFGWDKNCCCCRVLNAGSLSWWSYPHVDCTLKRKLRKHVLLAF